MSTEQEPQPDLPFDYQPWPGSKTARFWFHPTEEDLRMVKNQFFREDLIRQELDRSLANALEAAQKPPPPDLPMVTHAEWADYTKIVDRCKDPDSPLKAGLVTDHPIKAAELNKLTGSKSRNNYQSLIDKGLLHSFGKGKGAVPSWLRRPSPDASRLDWYELTQLQRRILSLFDGRTWCCRPADFEQHFLSCESWRDAKLRDGAEGLRGPEIAARLGMNYETNNHLRDELARLLKKAKGRAPILVKGKTSRRSRTHVGYLPNPRGWPHGAMLLPHCPAIDSVNKARRWNGQDELPQI